MLAQYNFTLELKKSNFSKGFIDHLGYVSRPRRLKIATHTFDAFKRLKPPTNIPELCSFLRLCNESRRFVPNVDRIETSLNSKLKKGQPKHFGDSTAEEMRVMHELQEELMYAPTLALPNATGKYTLDTDACNVQQRSVF